VVNAAVDRRGASGPTMTIGEVLSRLRPEFPDVTISKIRFLEEQGLVQPERTPAGYRKFGHPDLERLRYILELQRDHYLPLRVIRQHLQAMDRGQEPALPGLGPRAPHLVPDRTDLDAVARTGPEGAAIADSLTRAQLARAADVDEDLLHALESYGLLAPRPGGGYDADAAVIARTAGELAAFGIEPRHLRAFRSTAERESGLVEQVVTPLRRQRSDGSAARAEETGREVAALCVRLHAALLKTVLDRGSG
jgi:DNA-binding transcriptional MerR regulator